MCYRVLNRACWKITFSHKLSDNTSTAVHPMEEVSSTENWSTFRWKDNFKCTVFQFCKVYWHRYLPKGIYFNGRFSTLLLSVCSMHIWGTWIFMHYTEYLDSTTLLWNYLEMIEVLFDHKYTTAEEAARGWLGSNKYHVWDRPLENSYILFLIFVVPT